MINQVPGTRMSARQFKCFRCLAPEKMEQQLEWLICKEKRNMNYDECREWLEERRISMGSVPGLTEVNKLLDAFSRPDKDMNIIHIAGTNGKGSIGYLLEQSIALSKIKVGRFLSPAVIDEREIILVNGKMVAKKTWAEILTEIIDVINDKNLKATAFEIEFVLSLLIFKKLNCKLVILECGMGGRLDATNAIDNSLVDIISSISIDHCNFLGDSLKDISLHKFGIIKPTSKNVVIAPQKEDVYEYLMEYLKSNKIQFTDFDEVDASKVKSKPKKRKNKPYQVISYKDYKDYNLALAGVHQKDNAATVLDTIDVLRREGYDIKEKAVRGAFENALWPARFEVIDSDRLFILDGAHNFDAVVKLFENISLYFTNYDIVYIMGMYRDKAYEEVVKFAAPKAKAIVTITPKDKKRAVDSFELGKCVKEVNENVTSADSYEEALEMARLLSDKKDIILIFGSLSFMGDFRRLLLK